MDQKRLTSFLDMTHVPKGIARANVIREMVTSRRPTLGLWLSMSLTFFRPQASGHQCDRWGSLPFR